MNSNLKVDKEEVDGSVVYHLSGQIDEDASFEEMAVTSGKKIIFNLDQVNMINSCGIRNWVEFQSKIDQSVELIYQNCPQVIIEQLNIIKGFIRDGGIIESFYAPYYNNNTDTEVKILIKPNEVVDGKAPIKTDVDGNELEFDEIEQQYFNFLKK